MSIVPSFGAGGRSGKVNPVGRDRRRGLRLGGGLDGVQQAGDQDGLGDIAVEPERPVVLGAPRGDVGGERDHRGVALGTGAGAQALDHLDAAHSRHVDVHQDHVEGLFGDVLQRLGPGAGPDGTMMEGGEDLLHDAQVHRIVVHVQDDERTTDGGVGLRHLCRAPDSA